ncbi:MAG: hypothetical protein WDN26_08055 [Chitinophagaceae bacterium]
MLPRKRPDLPQMLNKEQEDERSAARDDDSSNAARSINPFFLFVIQQVLMFYNKSA